jgi:signal transduction histidine kinase
MGSKVEAHYERLLAKQRDELATFVGLVGHELKSPLGSMALQVGMLKRRLADVGGDKHLDLLARQILRMTRLINSFVDATLLERHTLSFKFEDYEIDVQLRDIIEVLQEEASVAGSPIALHLDNRHVPVYADPVRVEQTVTNLISNAIKYGEGKPITVTLSSDERLVKIAVADHGPGISYGKLKKIFERYGRLDEHRNLPGLGVGLWIANQIAKAHKGLIEVDSDDEGSTFTLVLPYDHINSAKKQ